MSSAKFSQRNRLVQSKSILASSLHSQLPTQLHLYALPFSSFYILWTYVYLSHYDVYLGSQEFTSLSLILLVSANALVFLLGQWSVTIKAWMTCMKTSDPFKATHIRVIPTEHRGSGELCPLMKANVTQIEGKARKNETQIYFIFQKKKYIYNSDKKYFLKITYPTSIPFSHFKSSKGHESKDKVQSQMQEYGKNIFDIPIPTFMGLFKEHVVAPFFVFQLFCVGLWFMDEYWYYSLFTLFMLLAFESTVVTQRLRTLQEFRNMSQKPYSIHVYREKRWIPVMTDDLIPGDIISIVRSKEDSPVPCDILILNGSCIVNEAMLSGESTPLIKESITLRDSNDLFDINGGDKGNVLFGGTKVLQVSIGNGEDEDDGAEGDGNKQLDPQNEVPNPPDGGCKGYVLRTGFGTSQGKLVRLMVYGTERVSANNFESFIFILFLLVFAISASAYVWIEGSKDPNRKKSKLILDCILIITSVVPPELPMELSMAVNTSLIALSKLAIYCTEPFRIPFAGKIDICCFDKTGTLTGEDLVVEGVAGLSSDMTALHHPTQLPLSTTLTLASAQALVKLEDNMIVGDPMERATLEAVGFEIGAGDVAKPKHDFVPYSSSANSKASQQSNAPNKNLPANLSIKIIRKFQFSSALKRMSTIAHITASSPSLNEWVASVKGAPETIKEMLKQDGIPKGYDETYKWFARKGSRVLALGWKKMDGKMNAHKVNELSRDQVESDLNFAGFLVFHCPLKADSADALIELNQASHRTVMITGDNALTACHVAKQVEIVNKDVLILDVRDNELSFQSIDESVTIPFSDLLISSSPSSKDYDLDLDKLEKYDLCVTGKALAAVIALAGSGTDRVGASGSGSRLVREIVRSVWVWARVSPTQKEFILTTLKSSGYTTLMVGDGTNDVGALKQAHIGVALLDGNPQDLEKIAIHGRIKRMQEMYEKQKAMAIKWNMPVPEMPRILKEFEEKKKKGGKEKKEVSKKEEKKVENKPLSPLEEKKKKAAEQQAAMAQKMMEALGDIDDEPPVLKFGDASIAAPFTSKLSTVKSITNIIKQGRCTLVTTIQMYKILALNCLISAYSMSVLYLDGMKWGDWQMTIQGMLIAVCFLCISRGQPLHKLSKERPLPNIFNLYIFLSVLGQFAIHCISLIYVTMECKRHTGELEIDYEGDREFEPNLLNSGVYLLSLSMQVSTFAINYQGRPFRESLTENTALYRGLAMVGGIAFTAALETFKDLNEWLQLVPFPEDFWWKLTGAMIFDFGGAWLFDVVTKKLFANAKPKKGLKLDPEFYQ
ncbi:hypothetical protein BKA69DRAFT_1101510 [Paraphysoderma sedebokerense]|nr:hypothetical protein BKA69DRAFT_1101510 [Paraphysoderma sedebokerense]